MLSLANVLYAHPKCLEPLVYLRRSWIFPPTRAIGMFLSMSEMRATSVIFGIYCVCQTISWGNVSNIHLGGFDELRRSHTCRVAQHKSQDDSCQIMFCSSASALGHAGLSEKGWSSSSQSCPMNIPCSAPQSGSTAELDQFGIKLLRSRETTIA